MDDEKGNYMKQTISFFLSIGLLILAAFVAGLGWGLSVAVLRWAEVL